jgi:hypothetical protein
LNFRFDRFYIVTVVKQSKLEIDEILNECKIRPPSLIEKDIPYKRDVVFKKHYSQPTYTLFLRPFVIPRDMFFVSKVLEEKYRGFIGPAMNNLAASYLYAGSSDMMRSFTCLFNGRVILGTIDIVDARYDELSTMIPLCKGDYIIRLMINTKKETVRPLHVNMLTVCMEYFFQFPEINQLFIPLDPSEKNLVDLVQKCGFFFYDKRIARYSSNIFCCTRQSLIVK